MVTPQKTWYIDPNIAPADITTANSNWQRTIFNLKQFLTGGNFYDDGVTVPAGSGLAGKMVVKGSSNGGVDDTGAPIAGVGAMDGVDRWTTRQHVVAATAGTNHAWIVLETAAGFYPNGRAMQLLIDCNITGNENVTFQVAQVNNGAGPLASNPFTGGSATTAPALPTNGVNKGSTQVVDTTPVNGHKMHAGRTSDGDFVIGISTNGAGAPYFGLLFLQATGGEASNNQYPALEFLAYSPAARGVFNDAQFASGTNLFGWQFDGVVNDSSPVRPAFSSTSILNAGPWGVSGGQNGQHPRVPIDVWQVGVNNRGMYQGRCTTDVQWTSTSGGIAMNTIEPGSDAFRYLCVGDIQVLTTAGNTWSM